MHDGIKLQWKYFIMTPYNLQLWWNWQSIRTRKTHVKMPNTVPVFHMNANTQLSAACKLYWTVQYKCQSGPYVTNARHSEYAEWTTNSTTVLCHDNTGTNVWLLFPYFRDLTCIAVNTLYWSTSWQCLELRNVRLTSTPCVFNNIILMCKFIRTQFLDSH